MENGLELQLLRFFVVVAQEQSLTKAAERLFTVQSNVSSRIKLLEEQVGEALFSRSKKGMFLTEKGAQLLSPATKLLADAQALEQSMKAPIVPESIRISVPDSFLQTRLIGQLSKLKAYSDDIHVVVKSDFSANVLLSLKNREVDIGVVVGRRKPTDCAVIHEFRDRLVLLTPPNVKQVTSEVLDKLEPAHLGDNCFFSQAISEYLKDAGKHSKKPMQLGSVNSILQCVAVGAAWSIVPESVVAAYPQHHDITIHQCPGKAAFSWYKVCLAERQHSQLMQMVKRFV